MGMSNLQWERFCLIVIPRFADVINMREESNDDITQEASLSDDSDFGDIIDEDDVDLVSIREPETSNFTFYDNFYQAREALQQNGSEFGKSSPVSSKLEDIEVAEWKSNPRLYFIPHFYIKLYESRQALEHGVDFINTSFVSGSISEHPITARKVNLYVQEIFVGGFKYCTVHSLSLLNIL